MKIRLLPTAVTMFLSAVLLFGGWFAYREMALQKPLDHLVNDLEGVESAKPIIDNSIVRIELELQPDADLGSIYRTIASEGKNVIGSRELQLDFSRSKSDKLDQIWSTVLFDVAEAMETKTYSGIPEAMRHLEQQYSGLQVKTTMDHVNVYITMIDGQETKFIVLPRTPARLEVWPDV
ncbi:hypothetical protein EBB07_19895 [Paenibacillaceae bacterium]|nr:hypothetical protein EBB07_19895 [Paenibacillaceae bacterium]